MAAITQIHAHHGIAGLEDGEIHRLVSLRARVRLHVGIFGAEQLFNAIYGDFLNLVDKLATAIEALARITLGILVGKLRTLRLHHGRARIVFRGDQLNMLILALALGFNAAPQVGINNTEIFCCAEHIQVFPKV